jgi:galactose mutarotase-like enzyme
MLFTLKNEKLRLTVESLGAEMRSLQTADGTEYLWQGDSRYWGDRAPNLFPFVGRLTNNSYKCYKIKRLILKSTDYKSVLKGISC